MYLAATEDDMDLHISANHGEHNSGILKLKNPAKEVELNKMIEQCRRWPLQQGHSSDSQNEFRRPSDLLDGPGTSTGIGNAAQNGPGFTRVKEEIGSDDDVMIIEDSNETSAMLNNSSHGDSPEQPTQEPDERIASVNPISNSEDLLLFPNAVMTKSEPSLSQENGNFIF
ncbi:hypothetical protein Ddc_14588 [Ditylenchus destructor]|nr:hypothetical protein Ddc_14588 [Ditylenchus destructor]